MRQAIPILVAAMSLAGPVASDSLFVTVRQAARTASAWEVPPASLTADGRYVAFGSYAQLSPSDTNSTSDVYVLDRVRATVSLETVPAIGERSDRDCLSPHLSADGRFVVYETIHDLSDDPADSVRVVVVRDRRTGARKIVQGAQTPNGPSRSPAISGDGRMVVFVSSATNLVDGADANERGEDVFAFDTRSGTVARVSVDSAGAQPSHGASFAPAISEDGRFVAFTSTAQFNTASNPPSKPVANVYVRDLVRGVTSRVSVARRSGEPNANSYEASVDGDGRFVVFTSDASNLVPGDSNGVADIFLRDMKEETTMLVSRGVSGGAGNGNSGRAAISTDGRVIVFQSDASDLVCGSRCAGPGKDINLVSDVFVFEVASRQMKCISTGRTRWMEPSAAPAVNATGTVIAFSSRHSIDSRDAANDFDLFVAPALISRRGGISPEDGLHARTDFTQSARTGRARSQGARGEGRAQHGRMLTDSQVVAFVKAKEAHEEFER